MSGADGQPSWILHIRKDNLKFSAAHMTVFPDGRKERLHGHNYQIHLDVELAEPPALARMLSYELFKQALRVVCAEWDERVLIAADSPWLEWLPGAADECAFRLCGKRYVLPADEVAVLATDNITAENLARLLFERFWAQLACAHPQPWRERLCAAKLRIDESRGQGATYAVRFLRQKPEAGSGT